MNKEQLHLFCIDLIKVKLNTVNEDLKQLKISSESDSKSAMGDKYETSTELINQERNKLESVKSQLLDQISLLDKVKSLKTSENISFGHLVNTTNGYFYFSVPLGIIEFESQRVACISLKSPIAQSLLNQKTGDSVSFNGRSIDVLEVI